MSRIGKQLITLPAGVTAVIEDQSIFIKGPKGELRQAIHPKVIIEQKDGVLNVSVKDSANRPQRALWGLFGSLVANMVTGVTTGFSKKLEITGVGFKAAASGKNLTLNVGYSHPVNFPIPTGIEVQTEGNVITVSGIDKQLVGEIAAQIRQTKKTEPYKGKGIKYVGEIVRRKAGKAAAKAK